MSLLNLESLYADHDQRRIYHQAAFDRILYQCHRKIEYVNKRLRLLECYFQIPVIVPGLPLYPIEKAARFVEQSLRYNGLWVVRTNPNTLYISWRPEDIDRQQYEKVKEQQAGSIVSSSTGGAAAAPMRISFPTPGHTSGGKGRGKGKEEEPSKIAMVRFGHNLSDMVPVNKDKLNLK